MPLDTDAFWRDGYLILRRALPQEMVSRWRSAALNSKPKRDLMSNDTLAEVVCHPVIVDAARQILSGQPIYFGDSTAMCGTGSGSGFHKDNSDRLDFNAPDWRVDRYPIIRFGIYTQSHGKLPYGLDLRVGSHNSPDYTSGKLVSAEVDPGDVVIWNGRTTHSGNSKIFKLIGYRPDAAGIFLRGLNRLGRNGWLFRDHPQERVAIFASYAVRGPLLDRHIEYLRQREYAVECWGNSEWSEVARNMAASVGLELLDVTQFEHDGRKLNRNYAPIPY